ncbi:hypothetical protein NQ317_000567 [Molorchus minor]|uniref:Protein kinase domain-containing protein n=1 Tax=Molorchus minor TaxID=1323400 RepID=A0ABQ9ISE1_9CUCU|nr:hypothetical protein NQ317_000567 [Molorchus minor]
MLTGELPWADTTDNNEEFTKWKSDMYISETPWTKLGNTALSLARQILNVDPSKRLTLAQIEKHPWMKFRFSNDSNSDSVDGSVEKSTKRWNSMVEAETRHNREKTPQVTLSQPVTSYRPSTIHHLVNDLKSTKRDQQNCFSQPIHYENLVIQFTQSPITKDNFHNLSKKDDSILCYNTLRETLEVLCSVLDSLHYAWTTDASGAVTISTVDFYEESACF